MVRLLSLSLALAASAQAQVGGRPVTFDSQVEGRALVVLASAASGVGASALAYYGIDGDGHGGVTAGAMIVAYPIGMALGAWAAGQTLGLEASSERITEGAVIGTGVGLGVGLITGLAATGAYYLVVEDTEYDFVGFAVGGLVGLGTTVLVSSAYLARRFEASPAVLAVPTGEQGLGLSLRLAL